MKRLLGRVAELERKVAELEAKAGAAPAKPADACPLCGEVYCLPRDLTLKKETTRPPRMNSLQQQARFDEFVAAFNTKRPHHALAMRTPAELYTPSSKPYFGLPELSYPLHDREYLVTACGRICVHRKKINISTVLAGQKLGMKEVDEGIWLVSFRHYDLGYIALEQKTLQPLDNPFGTRMSPISPEQDVT